MGYGANQKTCYRLALENGADIVIMVHPDYQYTPQLIPAMTSMIANGLYHCVLGSRILGGFALKGGMPWWKYVANRFLTLSENILVGAKLSEYHTGYRAFSRELIESLALHKNSDDFIFDNQMLCQILWNGYQIAEVSCPTKYFEEASSINFSRSVKYGIGCLLTASMFSRGEKWGLTKPGNFLPGALTVRRFAASGSVSHAGFLTLQVIQGEHQEPHGQEQFRRFLISPQQDIVFSLYSESHIAR